ncbi:venom protease-like [Chrysoperla carnea]|uniref:venom protease-like n=1 Tax=Chrysoperla carnea TaxID=189513 RepID=UPI001D071714|nr:venom protease-like [Chrysoperla carnea]
MDYLKFSLILLAGLFCYFDIGHAKSCVTPDGDDGECLHIDACPTLKSALYRITGQEEIMETSEFLNASTCSIDPATGDRIVCCPDESEMEKVPLDPSEQRFGKIELPDPDTCGISHANDAYSRIVGGFKVAKGQFPWIVALGYNRGSAYYPDYECGGSLISPNHILTAAHCIDNQPLVKVKIGTLNPFGSAYMTGDIVESYMHEKYNNVTNVNDIAIIKVQWKNSRGKVTDFTPSKTADTICLPKTDELRKKTYERYYPFVTGWGLQEWNKTESASNKLLAVQVPVVKNQLCFQKYKNFKRTIINPNVLCAGYMKEKHDSCQGDSGGPLMLPILVDGESRYYQIGVVSKGYRCAYPGMPAVYTRVSKYIEWITQKINL